jgi:hypothetical protein
MDLLIGENNMKSKTILILFLAFIPLFSFTHSGTDTTISKNYNLPGIGVVSLIYKMSVTDWYKPVQWSLIAVAENDTVFYDSHNDSGIDTFFYDKGFAGDCKDYLTCKKKWYLEEIVNFNVDTIEIQDTKMRELLKENSMQNQGNKSEADKKLWKEFWEYYKDKPMIAFSFPDTPVVSQPLRVYYPKNKKFLIVYEP